MLHIHMKDFNLMNDKEYKELSNNLENTKAPFALHTPDFEKIKTLTEKYKDFKNIILIGQGGQVQPVIAYYESLMKYTSKKTLYVLNSQDPDYALYVKSKCSKENTLVIASSKSGNTASTLEMLFLFDNYKTVAIATEGKGTLWQIVKKRNLDYLPVAKDIGGRFTGTSESAYFPLSLLGADIKKIHEGAQEFYSNPEPAMIVSCALHIAEQKNYTEVFAPIYSKLLYGFSGIITQLCHESFGKDNKGLTFLCSEAPESQHHTNQRFFGGRKNMVGFFIRTANFRNNITMKCPEDLEDIPFSDKTLKNLNLPYSTALHYEFEGTQKDAKNSKIPSIVLTINQIDEYNMGSLMAFWQFFAVYSSMLRNVNPFDQPQVENSKEITRKLVFDDKQYEEKYI